MQNGSQRSNTTRPLVFHTKADLHHFVMGNASQAYSLNVPAEARTAPQFHPNSSLFDRYNRPGLRLRDCDQRDIIMLHKNLVLSEQPLSREVAEEIAQKAKNSSREMGRNSSRDLAATGQLPRPEAEPPQLLMTAPLPAPTHEYQQNEVLFNYHGMAEAKRSRKLQFLEEIEARIAEAEQEIAGIEELREEERIEMDELSRAQARVGEQLTRNVEVGRIAQQVTRATGFAPDSPRAQPPRIHQQMEPREINEVLEEHIRANEDLLELAGSLQRTHSREKVREKKERNSLSNTMQRLPHQKSLASTTKAGFKPPKPTRK